MPTLCLLVNSPRNWLASKNCISNFLPILRLVLPLLSCEFVDGVVANGVDVL